jgi:8-oxo-dGTP pyrophosphatase MutT (NUDIX family)
MFNWWPVCFWFELAKARQLTDLTEKFSAEVASPVVRCQSAALCWRKQRGQLQILLVTSRETGRWVVPKGWLIAGLTDAETAAREAFEEAGVMGKVGLTPLGSFDYDKITDRAADADVALQCRVMVFPMRVTDLRKRFPESGERKRKWFARDVAATKVDEPELQALLAGFDPLSNSKSPEKQKTK